MIHTLIISSFAKNSIALTNSFSYVASVAHHPVVFLTQSGTVSALATPIVPDNKILKIIMRESSI